MIDLHAHILPGVDDGPASMDGSLAMARAALSDGITCIAATPHHRNGQYTNPRTQVLSHVRQLQGRLAGAGLPLTVIPGQEIHLHQALFNSERLAAEYLTLGDHGRYLLLELPPQIPRNLTSHFFQLAVRDLVPIIVHPERNPSLRQRPERLFHYVQAGAMSALTAASLLGRSGSQAEAFAWTALEHGLAQLIVSDGHDVRHRPPLLSEAYASIAARLGDDMAKQLQQTAAHVAAGDLCSLPEPTPVHEKRPSLWERLVGRRQR